MIECRVDGRTRAERAVGRLLADLPGPGDAWLVEPVPEIDEPEDAGHTRLRLRMTVTPTREWVATEAVPALLENLLDGHLVGSVHTWSYDAVAEEQYGRATVVDA